MVDPQPVPTRLSIVILTFRRVSMLQALLPIVDELATEAMGLTYEIVVIDNDPQGSARGATMVPGRSSVRYVHEPTPGIAAARKRGLAEAGDGDLMVFLDDDLTPQAGWLPPLVHLWEKSRAAAILGHVEYRLVGDIDPLIAASDFYRRRTYPSGTVLPTAATGNILLDVKQIHSLGVDFIAELGLTGGEDTLFCSQLVAAGGTIVYCAESVVTGDIGPDRANRTDTTTRLRAHAGIAVRNRLLLAQGHPSRAVIRTRAVVGGLVRMAIGALYLIRGSILRNTPATVEGIRLTARGRGTAQAGLGHLVEEYARNK